jgi:hypothetical protein
MRFFLEDSVDVSRPFEAVGSALSVTELGSRLSRAQPKRTAKRFTSAWDRRGRAGEWRVKFG